MARRRNMKLYNRMMTLLPDSAVRLVSSGAVDMKLNAEGPTFAWTAWSKRKGAFIINFTDEVADMRDDQVTFLWYHELGHIVLGHFASQAMDCTRPDRLVSADIAVNWHLRASDDLIREINGVVASDWLEDMKLGQQTYPFFILHDILHERVEEHAANCPGCNDEGEGEHKEGDGDPCGGIEYTDDPRAVARAISARQAAGADDSPIREVALGSQAGGLDITLGDSDLPDWLPALERHARSIVEVELADARTHKRAQPTLRSAGIRVPSVRPTYRPVPSTLCLLVDTSGSMLGDLHYVAPVLAYLKSNGITTRLIAGDTRVTFDEIIDRVPEKLEGAGGTDIQPLFQRAEDYEPKGLVCFTDGFVPVWPEDKGIPTLWVGCQTDVPYGSKA